MMFNTSLFRMALGLTAVLILRTTIVASTVAADAQAPFGDKVSNAITYYNRATPFMGSAGALKEGAVAEAKALGFTTIVDLRAPQEGTASEQKTVEAAGLTYINIPVATRAPTDQQVAEFARLVDNASLHPMLVHCQSANRVGAMWALYRTSQGVPATVAVEEGRTLGLKPSRERAVRQRLGLPPLKE